MKAIVLHTVIALLLLTGCKKEKEAAAAGAAGKHMQVKLEVVAEKDDNFSVYYTEDGSIDFSKEEPVWMPVQGSSKVQEVVFNLPEGVVPTQLRLDLGTNKEQEEVVLKKVSVVYFDQIFIVEGRDIFTFFMADHTKCTVDITTGTIKPVTKDGIRQSPSLYPHGRRLSRQLALLTQEQ